MTIPSAPLLGRVVTVSDRVAAGQADDRSGPLAVGMLTSYGVQADLVVVPDEPPRIAHAVTTAAQRRCQVLVLTGGTGVAPRDVTPETVVPMLDRLLPGFGEAIRAASRATVPTADLSRAFGGTLGTMVVLALPGSTGGVRDGLSAVGDLVVHAVEVLGGRDHMVTVAVPGAKPDRGSGSGSDRGSEQGPISEAPGRRERSYEPSVALCSVTAEPLVVADHAEAVSGEDAGAVVTFAGVVRAHDRGRRVRSLTYEAHPDAQRVLEVVAHQVAAETHDLARLAVSHRVGELTVGDTALVVATAAAHRSAALRACGMLVDEVKARLPVWKHQVFADGTDEWVNCP